MKTKDIELAKLLDRVPVKMLRAAVFRRQMKASRRHYFTIEELAEVDALITEVCERRGVDEVLFHSSDKRMSSVEARWEVYQELERRGFTVLKISVAVGHDRTRIYNGLKKKEVAA